MRPIDADIGREKLWEIYNAWNLAMAPADGREIAYVDKKMRLCELMIKFLDQLPTIPPPPNDPLTLEELRGMDGEPVWVEIPKGRVAEWCIAKWDPLMGRTRLWGSGGEWFDGRNCGKSVFAYRRRPEEEMI